MATIEATATTLNERVQDFLAQRRIAVAGVTRTRQDAANLIYQKLKETGYEVFPINPNVEVFEGDPCYPNLAAIPGGVDGVVIVTRPEISEEIVHEAAELGIKRVWMHQSFLRSKTSVSPEAAEFCREHGISVIDGACPMMYCNPVDPGHTCMRWMMKITGGLPK